MRRSPWRAGWACLLALALASLAACTSSPSSPEPSTSTSSAAPSTLLWWDISDQTGASASMRRLLDDFHTKYPAIDVTYVQVPPAEAQSRFESAAEAVSGAPDVVTVDTSWIADFASRGYLAKLDDTPATTGFDDQFPALVTSVTVEGSVMGVPRSADGPALLYNKAALVRAKVGVPKTWAQVSTSQIHITADGLETLYAPADSEGLLPWIYGEGGALIDPDAQTVLVNKPAAVKGLQLRLAMQATSVIVNDSSTGSVDNMRSAFRQGQVAMILDDAAAIPGLVGGSAFSSRSQIGIAPVPSGSVTSSSPLDGTSYVIYAGTRYPQASEQLVQFLDSTASQVTLAEDLGLLPTRISAYSAPGLTGNAVVQGFEPVIRAGTPLPVAPSNENLYPPLDDEFRSALSGALSAQAALDGVAAAYRKTFPDYQVTTPK